MPDIGKLEAMIEERKRKNAAEKAQFEEFAKTAKNEYGINHAQAELIYKKAYDDNHSSGIEEVEAAFDELCQLVSDCIKAK